MREFGPTERRRSRTYQPWGYHGLPVFEDGAALVLGARSRVVSSHLSDRRDHSALWRRRPPTLMKVGLPLGTATWRRA
jgi:hypothetical protein